jgi:bifunctional DNase/RNase
MEKLAKIYYFMLVEVKIGALIMDPNTNTPIVVLKGIDTETILPIWVGAFEANAIAIEIEKIASQRPLTHDLLKNFILEAGFTLSKVVISDLRNNTFYAMIEIVNDKNEVMVLDSRPSDAIALALRLNGAIFVEQKVFDVSTTTAHSEAASKEKSILPVEEWPDLIS